MLDKIIRFSLTQRLLLILFAVIIIVFGIWTYKDLPIDAFPDISTTQVQVILKAPGMGPVEVEQRITYPIEIQVRGIPRQTVLRSITKYALSVITIDFEEGTDIYWARQQVAERINQVIADLPEGVEGGLAPITMPLSDVYMFLVEGEGYSNMELRSMLDWYIRPPLLSVDGVADVNSLGGEVQSFHVIPNPDLLKAYDLSIDGVQQAVMENNRNAGGDRFIKNNEVVLIRTEGQIQTIEDIKSITVTSRDNIPIHVDDVAEVKQGPLTRYGAVVKNGTGEGVEGLVLNRRGANGRKTVVNMKNVMNKIINTLPKGVKINPFYDRTELITLAVKTVVDALIQAICLALIVLVIFLLDWRSSLTVGMILPLTVLGTFILMRFFGISANLMSLGGIVIAIGILVDSAVVMVENIYSKFSSCPADADKKQLIYDSAVEVAKPILSGVLIIIASFLPILSLTGVEGKLFRPLGLTVVFAVLTSLLLSLTVIPVIASILIKSKKQGDNPILKLLLMIYRPLVKWSLKKRKIAISLAVILLMVTIYIFPKIGKEFLPYLDEGTIVLQIEKLPSISLKKSIEIENQIQQALMEIPEVTGLVSRIGSDELRLDPMGLNESDVFVITKPRNEWSVKDPFELQEKMRVVLDKFPGINYGFTQPIDMRVSEMLTGVRAAVAIKLLGENLDILDQKAQEIESIIAKVPGSIDIFRTPLKGQKYLSIKMRYDVMSRYGVSVENINNLISLAVGGSTVTEVIEANRRIPVFIRYDESYRNSAETISDLLVKTSTGNKIRLGELTDIKEVDGPVQIKREDGQRQVILQMNVHGRDIVGYVNELRRRIEEKVSLPAGYSISFGGQFENQQRASKRLAIVFPVTLFLIFIMLFSTFNSIRQAGMILINVPFAMIGGVICLYLSGLYLSVPASVGFIALLGEAVMNGVVMVNYFNQLRANGKSIDEAVYEGAQRRMRPVLMTAILTVLGLLPLLLATGPGSEIQRPLALVVVGGTFSATTLTLFLLPTIYAWIEKKAAPAKK